MFDIPDHPDIASALRTGYPRSYFQEEEETDDTEWVPIEGSARYSISVDGRVRDDLAEEIVEPMVNSSRHYVVTLKEYGTEKTYLLHRLVAQHFISNPKGYLGVKFVDGCKENCHADNLLWCERSKGK